MKPQNTNDRMHKTRTIHSAKRKKEIKPLHLYCNEMPPIKTVGRPHRNEERKRKTQKRRNRIWSRNKHEGSNASLRLRSAKTPAVR